MERVKRNSYLNHASNYYFWRTYQQEEIDLVEENTVKLFGYEFKWKKKNSNAPKLWLETYENAEFKEINNENYLNFTLK